MFGVYTVRQIRDAEAAAMAGRPELELMRRAATGLAHATARELRRVRGAVSGGHVLVLVGAGNNGGDALFAAQWLARHGVGVRAWRVFGSAHEAGWRAFLRSGGSEVSAAQAVEALSWADLVLDGVLGIGGRPGLPPVLSRFEHERSRRGLPVVAVDLPTGLDADSGVLPEPEAADPPPGDRSGGRDVTIRGEVARAEAERAPSHLTSTLCVTFGARKSCHVLQPAAGACGRVEVVDIGLDLPAPALGCWEPADVAAAWPLPGAASDKYKRGVVGIDAGSARYPGAGVLATLGAVYSGAGMVRFMGSEPAVVRAVAPNVVFGDGRVQALVLGPGWGDRPDGADVIARAAAHPEAGLVIDADGLRYLPTARLTGRAVLTPHAGELARLLDTDRKSVEADPVGSARAMAARCGAVVLLKGAVQVVASPDGRVQVAVAGPAWTAQAGSGDVLAGVIGTLLAAGLPAASAAVCGASLQALTASAHPGPLPPQDLARHFPDLIAGMSAGLFPLSAGDGVHQGRRHGW